MAASLEKDAGSEPDSVPETDSVVHFLREWRRERPDLDPEPSAIMARVHRISNRLLRLSEAYLAPHGLSWEVFSVLVTLRRAGAPYERRPTDLLRESLLTSGAITHRLDKVERMGLIARHADGQDRRSVPVRLTPQGLEVANAAIADHFDFYEKLFSALDETERAQLAALLAKLLGSLERAEHEANSIRRRARRQTPAEAPARARSQPKRTGSKAGQTAVNRSEEPDR